MRRRHRRLGFGDPAGCLRHASHRPFHAGLVAIELVARNETAADQFLGALQGLAGQRCIGLRLAHPGPRFIHRLLRLHHLRLGSPQLGAQIVGIEPPDHRARLDPVPLARPKLSQAPGDLGGNIDFSRLQAAVARGKTGGKPGRAMLVNVIGPSGKHRQSEHPKDKIANAHQVHKPPN